MLYYTSLATDLGEIALGATEQGLCRLSFGAADDAWREHLCMTWQQDIESGQAQLADAIGQLREYLSGERDAFDLGLDLSQGTIFQQAVWRTTMTIPYGQVYSYGQVAALMAKPRAARAVGNALGRNPVPVIVPCHRVVTADGSLGGFSIGLPLKRALLRIEGHPLGVMTAGTAQLLGFGEP